MMTRIREFLPFIGWAVAGAAIIVIVVLMVFMRNNNAMIERSIDRLEYREKQMESFFLEQRKENARIAKSDIDRENYIAYFSNVITEFYSVRPANRSVEMTMAERRRLLGLIYDYAKGPGFPYSDEFLPIAYLRVESEFYPYMMRNGRKVDIRGTSDERSMFQFMPATARELYRKHGRDFDHEWWKSFDECVWLWFVFNNELAHLFTEAPLDLQVRWTAYAYNRGTYRNELVTYYQNDRTIEQHLRDWPFRAQGDPDYNKNILHFYNIYRDGFRANSEG